MKLINSTSAHDATDHQRITHEAAAQGQDGGGTPPPVLSGGSSAGAPPSNTAPANSMGQGNDLFNVLRFGIDSLYLSYPGCLCMDAYAKLLVLKELAQSSLDRMQSAAIYPVLGHRFEVHSKGSGRFPYVLSDNAYRIALAGFGVNRNVKRDGDGAIKPGTFLMPMAYVQVRSHWLTAKGVKGACSDLSNLITIFGEVEDSPDVPKVGRVDLFVDFVTSHTFDDLPKGSWVTRAKSKSTHEVADHLSGFSIGLGGDLSARLYDKTLQIEVSGQDYLKPLWTESGWDGEQIIWRLEFQFKRRILVEHGVPSVPALLSNLGRLWLYATTHWLRLALPNPSDETRSRWPLHPLWLALSQVPWTGTEQGASLPVRTVRAPSDRKMFVNGLSGVTSYMGLNGITDFREGFTKFMEAARAYHDERVLFTFNDFAAYLRAKAAAKARAFNVSYPGVDESAEAATRGPLREVYRRESNGE